MAQARLRANFRALAPATALASMSPMPSTPEPALLIALTGSPGEGRTSQLAALVAEIQQRGHRVAGLLAPAEGGRRCPSGDNRPNIVASNDRTRSVDDPCVDSSATQPRRTRGAAAYRLHVLGESGDRPWAERDDSLQPPYRFHEETRAYLSVWAAALRDQPPADLLVLDEFGRCEAQGAGLFPLWGAIAASAPRIVVIAVRAGYVAEIEARLGRKFDLCLAAAHPATPERLRQACAEFGEWTQVGLWGGAAGSIEMTLGSALHTMKIPLRGATLSSMQAATLTFASARLNPPGRVAWVAFISAGLKAFSPGGGRVRPMVAIAMQGTLFSGAVQLLGWNFLSVALGGALIGAWAALQGFLLQYLLLGDDLVQAYGKVVRWLADNWQIQAPSMPVLLTAWAALHALMAGGAALVAWKLRAPPRALRSILEREAAKTPAAAPLASAASAASAAPRPPLARRVAREFARWHFWVPLVAVALVLLANGRSWESVAWLVARFVAVGAVFFALLSFFQPVRFAAALRRRGWWGPAAAFAEALSRRRSGK
jgi:hypothetical protein